MRIVYNILHKKLLSLVLFLPLVGCGFSDMNYVSRQNLNSDPLYQLDRSDMTLPTNYGAIKFQEQDDSDSEGRLFVLQKKKKVYQVETMLKATKDRKYYFAVGMDYKTQAPHLSLRIEF